VNALPRAHGPAVLAAWMRSEPDDFVVEEVDAFAASGSGEHLLLTVEKRGMNTAFAQLRMKTVIRTAMRTIDALRTLTGRCTITL